MAAQGHSNVLENPSREVQFEMFRKMLLIQLCDAQLISTIRAGRLAAPHYSPRGQEAISAAVAVNMEAGDYLLTIYRGLHDHVAKGVPLKALFAEYAGRSTGACGGKGGPMHITHPASGVMVTTGIVGSGIPIANGFALASQIRGDGRVTVTNFGDGATNIGSFHEALNMASLWKLPAIFLCHNNGYGEHTRFDLGTSVASVVDRAPAYSMRGVAVDGNDPVAIWHEVREAVGRARKGEGPTLIEAKTFRFNGHNLGDPGEYIPKEVYAAALERDPIPLFRKKLIHEKIASEEQLTKLQADLTSEVSEAMEYALSSPWPAVENLTDDVFKSERAAT